MRFILQALTLPGEYHVPTVICRLSAKGDLNSRTIKFRARLNNISGSCQVCHREETDNLIRDVYSRQDKIIENRNILETLLVRCHVEAKTAWDKGATEEQMKDILNDIRHAQWRWDFSAAGHGNSFHSPVEMGRIISGGIAGAQEAVLSLHGFWLRSGITRRSLTPIISTKAKAQEYIGLDMKKFREEKKIFIETILPGWINPERRGKRDMTRNKPGRKKAASLRGSPQLFSRYPRIMLECLSPEPCRFIHVP